MPFPYDLFRSAMYIAATMPTIAAPAMGSGNSGTFLASCDEAGVGVTDVLANLFTEGVSVTDGDLDTLGVGVGVEIVWHGGGLQTLHGR